MKGKKVHTYLVSLADHIAPSRACRISVSQRRLASDSARTRGRVRSASHRKWLKNLYGFKRHASGSICMLRPRTASNPTTIFSDLMNRKVFSESLCAQMVACLPSSNGELARVQCPHAPAALALFAFCLASGRFI